MRVLFVAAEMAPLAKVGGVGDVAAALPRALRRLGLDVRVALPYYKSIRDRGIDTVPLSLKEGEPALSAVEGGLGVRECVVRDVPVYLIEHPHFDRDQIYGYKDDTARFLAFTDGLLATAESLPGEPGGSWRPDVIHLNDWHTGFLASRLSTDRAHAWSSASRLFTIHNLGYAGPFHKAFARAHTFSAAAVAAPAGLPPRLPYSALAQGILHADLVTTVSPTYAREIRGAELGGAFAPLLVRLGDRLAGVLNGIDVEEFDPARDPALATRFDAASIEHRVENKRALQERLGLPVDDAVPLVAIVSRLFVQKGSDLAAEAIERLLARREFQFAVLGTGDAVYEQQLLALAERHPQRVAVRIAFDAALGQLFYAGCDLFLMPSRYEPCGLGQMIAMRYGAIPVVRRTGGLADSVPPFDAQHDAGAGFLFDEATAEALAGALDRALGTYEDRASWRALQLRAMALDVSWDRAARKYEELYRRAGQAGAK